MMPLRIDHPDADRLAQELISYTGETIPQAVIAALRERLERQQQTRRDSLAKRLLEIGRECAALPVLDARTPEEILGYDDHGALA